ncbi:hypothetical protein MLD38_011408 [Melastoma candidum]|uniref:Uncharacterized protein n=1 Tax=Melastoma candidum TaxID=119954 RepID=A0ACB9R5Z6_9MYRT|nr:hypothetical protein MLD38_011408 [Melastoma candidum]
MDVIFEPQRGKPFDVEVGFFDTVLEIKLKSQKDRKPLPAPQVPVKFEQPCPPQVLPCNGSNIQLNVRIPLTGSFFSMEVDAGDSIPTLKERIHEVAGVGVNNIVLHVEKAYLDDHSGNGSGPGSGVYWAPRCLGGDNSIVVQQFKEDRVMVLPKWGTTKIPVEIGAADNMAELRKEMQSMQERMNINLPPEGYFFIYKHNVMDEDRSFWWHHGNTIDIFNGSITGRS